MGRREQTRPGRAPRDPFADLFVSTPRRIEPPVSDLNRAALDALVADVERLLEPTPDGSPPALDGARLVLSPEHGYGKTHLLGRLFKTLEGEATCVYLTPYVDPQQRWRAVVERCVEELAAPIEPDIHPVTHLEHMATCVVVNLAQRALETEGDDLRQRIFFALGDGLEQGTVNITELLDWIDDELSDALPVALTNAGLALRPTNRAWTRVFLRYARAGRGSRERAECVEWMRTSPIEPDQAARLGLRPLELIEPTASLLALERVARERLSSLCKLALFHRPLLLCFDQTESFAHDPTLARSFGNLVCALASDADARGHTFPNQMTIVTANQLEWTRHLLPSMVPAEAQRFRAPVYLEMVRRDQAEALLTARLRRADVSDEAAALMLDPAWLDAYFGADDASGLGVRQLLIEAQQRWQSLDAPTLRGDAQPFADATPADARLPGPALDAALARSRDALLERPDLLTYREEDLRWLVDVFGPHVPGVEREPGDGMRYVASIWHAPSITVFFVFEAGHHHSRWGAIRRDADELCQAADAPHAKVVVLRAPELRPIPGDWQDADAFARAMRSHLDLVCLSVEQLAELRAARQLHLSALEGAPIASPEATLAHLVDYLKPWWERLLAPLDGDDAPLDDDAPAPPPSSTRPASRPAPPPPSPRAASPDAAPSTGRAAVQLDLNLNITGVSAAPTPPPTAAPARPSPQPTAPRAAPAPSPRAPEHAEPLDLDAHAVRLSVTELRELCLDDDALSRRLERLRATSDASAIEDAWLIDDDEDEDDAAPAANGWALGARFHRCAQALLEALRRGDEAPPPRTTSDALWRLCTTRAIPAVLGLEWLRGADRSDEGRKLKVALRVLCKHLHDLARAHDPAAWRDLLLAVEQPLRRVTHGLVIRGRADLLRRAPDGGLEIIDHKLRAAPADPHLTARDRLQLALYAWLIEGDAAAPPVRRGVIERYQPRLTSTVYEADTLRACFNEQITPVLERLAAAASTRHTDALDAALDTDITQDPDAEDSDTDDALDAALDADITQDPDADDLHPDALGPRIVAVLAEHGAEVAVAGPPRPAPQLIRYRLRLLGRTTIQDIERHARTLRVKLALSHEPTIQGAAGHIHLDVPRPRPVPVPWRALQSDPILTAARASHPLVFPLGVDTNNEPLLADLGDANQCHMLVAGASGSGKSVFLQGVVASLATATAPQALRLTIIDPKRVTFSALRDLPHLDAPILHDAPQALARLESLISQMDTRYAQMARAGLDDVQRAPDPARFPRHLIIIDEFADLLADDDHKALLNATTRLAKTGRAAGFHLLLATQNPLVSVLPSPIKANLPLRVCFRVTQRSASQVVLDRPGAERLLGRGDFLSPGPLGLRRGQAPLISRDELLALVP